MSDRRYDHIVRNFRVFVAGVKRRRILNLCSFLLSCWVSKVKCSIDAGCWFVDMIWYVRIVHGRGGIGDVAIGRYRRCGDVHCRWWERAELLAVGTEKVEWYKFFIYWVQQANYHNWEYSIPRWLAPMVGSPWCVENRLLLLDGVYGRKKGERTHSRKQPGTYHTIPSTFFLGENNGTSAKKCTSMRYFTAQTSQLTTFKRVRPETRPLDEGENGVKMILTKKQLTTGYKREGKKRCRSFFLSGQIGSFSRRGNFVRFTTSQIATIEYY